VAKSIANRKKVACLCNFIALRTSACGACPVGMALTNRDSGPCRAMQDFCIRMQLSYGLRSSFTQQNEQINQQDVNAPSTVGKSKPSSEWIMIQLRAHKHATSNSQRRFRMRHFIWMHLVVAVALIGATAIADEGASHSRRKRKRS
jgi:hypothetical protein